jgi:phenylpyruvate tautomerase PptA (4-oxalocrotonate tautomerase family)
MPLVKIHSAVEIAAAAEESLVKELSRITAEGLGKSEKWVMACLMPHARMTFGGDEGPCAYLEVKSIGTMTPSQTETLSAAITDTVSRHMQVPKERIYIEFSDAEPYLWGWNGSTFA